MKIDCGIIGLPNVGKSTLFNIITNISVKIANFPFCTIDPNIGIVYIPDNRVHKLNNIIKSRKIMYGFIKFIDFAGLITGASKGEGLGNKILNDLKTVKVLCHVVRCFENNQIIHINNSNIVHPCRDIDIVNTELILFDILECEKILYSFKKNRKYLNLNSHFEQKLSILQKALSCLDDGILLRNAQFSETELKELQKFNFLTSKPVFYMMNANSEIDINNINLSNLDIIDNNKKDVLIISCCLKILFDALKKNNKKSECILRKIMNSIFTLLHLQTFFTANVNMVRAWISYTNITALEAANKVHSDFKKGFIRAKIIKINDFISYKGELGVKKAGKIQFQGRDYYITDGDIVEFLFR